MTLLETQQVIQIVATVVGIIGGIIGLVKYFADKRNVELREWQKVVLCKILRQNESQSTKFTALLEKYRSEAHAFTDFDLRKKEISEDALRRVLLELAASKTINFEKDDSYRLNIVEKKSEADEWLNLTNEELVKLVAPNPFVYTLDEVVKEIAPKVGLQIPILRNELRKSIAIGYLIVDDASRVAFPR